MKKSVSLFIGVAVVVFFSTSVVYGREIDAAAGLPYPAVTPTPAPVAIPEQSTAQPAAQPEQPAAQPEQPAAQPEQPATQPEQPATQPEQSAESGSFEDQLLIGNLEVKEDPGCTHGLYIEQMSVTVGAQMAARLDIVKWSGSWKMMDKTYRMLEWVKYYRMLPAPCFNEYPEASYPLKETMNELMSVVKHVQRGQEPEAADALARANGHFATFESVISSWGYMYEY